MKESDVAACARVQGTALAKLRVDLGLPPTPHGRNGDAAAAERVAHLLRTDPDGSLVAEGSTIVGFGQASRRDRCWTLAHLFIEPSEQSHGAGTALLHRLDAWGQDLPVGLIGSTADPRAMRAYARLPGFRLHPAVRAEGSIRHRPASSPAVVPASRTDAITEAVRVDDMVRGGGRAADLAHLLDHGHEAHLIVGRGYVISSASEISTLAATDNEAAAALLADALARADANAHLVLPRMTSDQHWAIPVILNAGLELRPWGPLAVRGLDSPPAPYLPHPALC
ncbi:MAG: GNAT family N-acetyltransferase [Actinomycetota bacterium]|nr:GNAT family N-acetyltransferase [Actinomycetota bacterium]